VFVVENGEARPHEVKVGQRLTVEQQGEAQLREVENWSTHVI
jgi:hypothetical protein